MKKHISVFMLMARSSIYRVFFAILGMLGLEALFLFLSQKGTLLSSGATLEDTLTAALIPILFIAGLLAVTVFLCRTGCEFSAKSGYTLKRLSISEKQVFLWQAAYNTLAYLLLWLAQALMLFLFARWYAATKDGSGLGAFMLFFRSGFARGCWPMESAGGFIRNVCFCLMLGVTSARYPMAQRQGKRFGEVIPAILVTIALWNRSLSDNGANDFLSLLAVIFFLSLSLSRVLKKEVPDFYEEA